MIWRRKSCWGWKEKHNEEDSSKWFKRNKAQLFRKKNASNNAMCICACMYFYRCLWQLLNMFLCSHSWWSEKQLCFYNFHESIWSRIGEISLRAILTERSIVIWSTDRAIMWGVTLVLHRGFTRTWGKDLKNVLYMGRNFNQSSQLVRHRSQSTMKHESIGD